jgi:hypothetical protein
MAFLPSTVAEAIVNAELRSRAAEAIYEKNGYEYINGTMIAHAISPIIARVIAIGRVIRPNIGATEEFTSVIDVDKVLSVTVQLPNPLGVTTRTIGTDGTPNNAGLINRARKIIPSTTPFNIPLAQVNDQPLFFPRLQLETALYDVVVETLAQYADTCTISMDSYHIAKAISYAGYRAGIEAKAYVEDAQKPIDDFKASNIVRIDPTKVYNDNYMVQIINDLTAKMSKGDPSRGALTFIGPRMIAARNALIGWMTSPKTGFVSNYNDYGQKLLLEPNFDLNIATRYGSNFRGDGTGTKGYALQEANDALWHYAEKWLGLNFGDLDGVYGVVFTPLAYAMGGAANINTTLVQASDYDGIVCFPYQKFGGAAYRKIFLLVDKDWEIPESLFGEHKADAVKGKWTLAITNKGANGDHVTVFGVKFDQKTSPVADTREFGIGADAAATAALLIAKIQAEKTITDVFDVSISDTGVITFEQKRASESDDYEMTVEFKGGGSLAGTLTNTVPAVDGEFEALSKQAKVVAPADWGIVTYEALEDNLNQEGATFNLVSLPTTE